MNSKQKLIGLNCKELTKELEALGFPSFRAKQIWYWVYNKGVQTFEEMTNLPIAMRAQLDELYSLERMSVSKELISFDETRKWLLKLDDGNEIETVFIPDGERGTICISSQVGCTLTCKFCHTGTQLLVRNLTAHEIIAQYMHVKDALEDWPASKEGRKVTNIVMMGMGEPLYNYDNVSEALKIIMDADGLGLSRRKITLSTSGVVPMIEQCGSELGVNLAISLHAVRNELRNTLVPLNKKYPIEELLAACKKYPALKGRERITFEYVMLKDVNDSEEDARELVKLIKNIPAKINLIPFNPWDGAPFECSTNKAIKRFAMILEKAGYTAPVRTPRGQDIMAACGQLKSESIRQKKSRLNDESEGSCSL
ncbi:MAG: 23S rRNA (adenine(2503)-C(2))-methyltransferase RlmN [Candidatus Jidaibacter sp.]|jgi:23S rRNA (adenine2503-C2)-methyltransferase|nr:23S rRNA (adenine(2503)-C(2))-methyltransferase RlmN [Candidatus Jidaibacter sp.]